MTEQIMCSCTGRKCEGSCRIENLNRERIGSGKCPASYYVSDVRKPERKKRIKNEVKFQKSSRRINGKNSGYSNE